MNLLVGNLTSPFYGGTCTVINGTTNDELVFMCFSRHGSEFNQITENQCRGTSWFGIGSHVIPTAEIDNCQFNHTNIQIASINSTVK